MGERLVSALPAVVPLLALLVWDARRVRGEPYRYTQVVGAALIVVGIVALVIPLVLSGVVVLVAGTAWSRYWREVVRWTPGDRARRRKKAGPGRGRRVGEQPRDRSSR